jgi:hypothetical protein
MKPTCITLKVMRGNSITNSRKARMLRTCGKKTAADFQDIAVLNFLTRLFNKPKEPIIVKKMLCSKHGELSHFALWCNKVEYPFCGQCLGEFLLQTCKVEVIEKVQEK